MFVMPTVVTRKSGLVSSQSNCLNYLKIITLDPSNTARYKSDGKVRWIFLTPNVSQYLSAMGYDDYCTLEMKMDVTEPFLVKSLRCLFVFPLGSLDVFKKMICLFFVLFSSATEELLLNTVQL